jgi:hypothetical protein
VTTRKRPRTAAVSIQDQSTSADWAEPGGHTRSKMFGIWVLAGAAGIALMTPALASGSIAAHLAVAGQYKATADRLDASGTELYGSTDHSPNGDTPVLVNGYRHAVLDHFCQSIVIPLPGVGDTTVRITAPGSGGVVADNLILDVAAVSGDIDLQGVEIGRDTGQLAQGPPMTAATPGSFGIQSSRMTINHVHVQAWATTASDLRLNHARISVNSGRRGECF